MEEAVASHPQIQSVPLTAAELISFGEEGKLALKALVEQAQEKQLSLLEESSLTFGPCVPEPQKIICVGLNYKHHADECNMAYPTTPILFSKFANTLTGHKAEVKLPLKGTQFDYEAELVIVIGKAHNGYSEKQRMAFVQ